MPGQGVRRPQPPSPADREAAGCPLPPGRVAASVTMNLHRSLLTPCQTTNANPSRPPPVPKADPSAEQDRREPPPLRAGPRVLEPDRLEQLQQPLARGAFVPLAVALDGLQQLVGGAVAVAARGEDPGKLVARLQIVGIGGD